MLSVSRGDHETAAQHLRTNLDWCKTWLSKAPVDEMTIWHQEELGKALMELKRYGEAFPHLRDAYAVRTAVEPDADRTFETMRNHAFVSTELGKVMIACRVYSELVAA